MSQRLENQNGRCYLAMSAFKGFFGNQQRPSIAFAHPSDTTVTSVLKPRHGAVTIRSRIRRSLWVRPQSLIFVGSQMPMLRISVRDSLPCIHGSLAPLAPTLQHAMSQDHGPVKIMIHGFKYLPGHPGFCPHDGILSRHPTGKAARMISWPRHLGLRGQKGEGLGLSFGWNARGSIWKAYEAAQSAGDALARLIDNIATLAPDRPIQLIAHSLGARVAIRAIHQSRSGVVTHAILMAAAEYQSIAERALRSPSGQRVNVLNVSSRENDVFDYLLERLIPRPQPHDRMLGHGSLSLANMATLQLDDPLSLEVMRSAGYPIAKPQRRICHWSPYLRPGIFPLYRAFLKDELPVCKMRAELPSESQPRWSRLRIPRPRLQTDQSAMNLG